VTTLADMTLRVAREITEVLYGTATAGTGTTITDTDNLTQQNAYWDKGSLWILGLTHIGKTAIVKGFSANVLTFADFGSTVGTCRYAAARSHFPYRQLVQAINAALDEIRVLSEDTSLTGDGETLEFALPTGVVDMDSVEFTRYGTSPAEKTPSHHWKIRGGKIKWDYGYAPCDGDTIHLWHYTHHDELTIYSDTLDQCVNEEWLKWKACEHALYWGIKTYQDAKEYRLEELMNKAIERQKGLLPQPIKIKIKSAGA